MFYGPVRIDSASSFGWSSKFLIQDLKGTVALLNFVAGGINLMQTRVVRAIGFGLVAFTVVFGLDLLLHVAHRTWLSERLPCDCLEAALAVLIFRKIALRREASDERHERQMGYLNHHVPNSLAVIILAEESLSTSKARMSLVGQATRKICSVIEQLSRDEEVAIDDQNPARIGPKINLVPKVGTNRVRKGYFTAKAS
jgi:hypothetical protein